MNNYPSETPDISVLVPVYNTEKYLEQCLDSIINQTHKNLEIIILDDGSTDASPSIIQTYAAQDSRIRVVQKYNTGYGHTLNLGISLARGKYIAIVESDDYAALTMFETLYSLAQEHKVDIINSSFYRYWSGLKCRYTSIVPKHLYNKKLNPQNNPQIFKGHKPVWSALYRRDFLLQHNITFLATPGASYQDTSFIFKAYALAQLVFFTDIPLIYYRQNNLQSSCNNRDKIFCVCDEFKEVERFIKDSGIVSLRDIFYERRIIVYLWNLSRLSHANRKIFLAETLSVFKESKEIVRTKGICLTPRIRRKLHFLTRYPALFLLRYRIKDIVKEFRCTIIKKS